MHDHLPIETERLVLRPWREADFAPFAAMNADPEVMAHFPSTLTSEQSDAAARRIGGGVERDGHGFFAVEVKNGPPFIGFIGLNVPSYGAWLPCGPCLEIGWRLARQAWGLGYATEGARACLGFAFQRLTADRVYSFTAVGNTRSRAVMQRLGMERDPHADFDHPWLTPGGPVTRHVLYHIDRETWASRHL